MSTEIIATPKFDRFVKKFTDAGVTVKITNSKQNAKSCYSVCKEAIVIGGDYDHYFLARVDRLKGSDSEGFMPNGKMSHRLLNKNNPEAVSLTELKSTKKGEKLMKNATATTGKVEAAKPSTKNSKKEVKVMKNTTPEKAPKTVKAAKVVATPAKAVKAAKVVAAPAKPVKAVKAAKVATPAAPAKPVKAVKVAKVVATPAAAKPVKVSKLDKLHTKLQTLRDERSASTDKNAKQKLTVKINALKAEITTAKAEAKAVSTPAVKVVKTTKTAKVVAAPAKPIKAAKAAKVVATPASTKPSKLQRNVAKMHSKLQAMRDERSASDDKKVKAKLTEKINALKAEIATAKAEAKTVATPAPTKPVKAAKVAKASTPAAPAKAAVPTKAVKAAKVASAAKATVKAALATPAPAKSAKAAKTTPPAAKSAKAATKAPKAHAHA